MVVVMKELKLVEKLKESISPKLRWLSFSNKQNKSASEYLEMVSGVELQSMSDALKLEAKVREQLKADFPNIESNKSYELLVDAVMHNLRKKQLQAEDSIK